MDSQELDGLTKPELASRYGKYTVIYFYNQNIWKEKYVVSQKIRTLFNTT